MAEGNGRDDRGREPHVERMKRASRAAEARIRFGRSLRVAATAATVAFACAAVLLVLRKTGVTSERLTVALLVVDAALFVLACAVAFARSLPPAAGALALDRHHGLSGRISSALAFAARTGSDRSAFMDAAIDDAAAFAPKLDPRGAVPLRMPPDAPWAVAFAAVFLLAAVFEIRKHEPRLTAETIDAVDMTADDLDAVKDFLREMDQQASSDETKAAVQEFNQLVEDLAAKRLDRTEAFRKMQALETKLLEGREADRKTLEEALAKIGEELKKSELTKPAGEALESKNLAQAEERLKQLAKRLREKGAQIDKAQLERMRDALKRASESQDKRAQALAERRQELERALLRDKEKQKERDAGENEQEKSLLRKRERELERLDRDLKQQEAAKRQLDRLDRELAQAAEDLMRDLGLSADDLDEGAEDINRMAREQMTDQEKDQLRQRLEELREMLRQQGQGGGQQMARLRRFQQRARGGQGQGQPQRGQGGQDGQQGQEGGEGQDGQGGQDGQDGQDGQGQQGQNGQGQSGQKPGELWVLGPNGEKLLMISRGRGTQGQGGGQGDPQRGRGAGTQHDANVQGKATNPSMGTTDTQVAGQDSGQGQSRSEVILGAAEKGFASRQYQRVYREYHTVAEEALNQDEIPGGYRFYVRRYFQLIRPRDDAP
jgi:hypothetical protein